MAAKRSHNYSVQVISLVTLVACLILASDVFYVAVGKMHLRSSTNLEPYIDSANVLTEKTKALRGNIFDSKGNVIAQDTRTYNVVCILDENRKGADGTIAYVKDKERTAEVLARCLRTDYDTIYNLLQQDVYQTELGNAGRGLSKAVKDEIESYELPGIEFTDSIQRIYPIGQFASHLIGYAKQNENGSTVGEMGLELYLNSFLEGKDGSRTYQVDQYGYVLPGMKENIVSAVNGNNVYLTLNSEIQKALEQALEENKQHFGQQRAWASVVEVKTGKVLGWAQDPSFDPNYLEGIVDYNDTGTMLPYEPGSTLKTFVWAAAMNEGVYDPNRMTDGDAFCFVGDANNNPVRTYSQDNYGCIYNAHEKKYGQVDYDLGLLLSLNTVAAAIQTEAITPDIHLEYLKRFGFFKSVDTDGIVDNPGSLNFYWPSEKLVLSYGHGSSVTMLQLMQAYSAIFGDGRTVKPYFVESIRDYYDNKVIYQAETEYGERAISEETAKKMQSLLHDVAYSDRGFSQAYQIPECHIGLKTGTTITLGDSGYDDRYTISSVMIGMPIEDPEIMVYFAYEHDTTAGLDGRVDAITGFLRKAAIICNLSSEGKEEPGVEAKAPEVASEQVQQIKSYEMPSLVNHSLEFVNEQLKDKGVELIILGDGDTVINQYPNELGTIKTGQRVFITTNPTNFALPNMTGWTRKDVTALWSISGIGITIEGEGKVKSQSVPAGTVVAKDTPLTVVLE